MNITNFAMALINPTIEKVRKIFDKQDPSFNETLCFVTSEAGLLPSFSFAEPSSSEYCLFSISSIPPSLLELLLTRQQILRNRLGIPLKYKFQFKI